MSATPSLWPDLIGQAPRKGMREMLYDAAGDVGSQTGGKLEFVVHVVGIGKGSEPGVIRDVRHNCYLRVPSNKYDLLLFRVTTPVANSFPAHVVTPEGEDYPNLTNEAELRDAIQAILHRERTKEVVLFLLNAFS